MTDPFDVLRLPAVPLAPDPEFAAQLRRRLTDALVRGDDQGGPMTTTDSTNATSSRTTRPTISAYLAVGDARAALGWYADVFGGAVGDVVEMPDGRLGHAEIRIGDSTLMLADEFPELELLAPPARGGTTVSVVIDVQDVDSSSARAAAAGATVDREPSDMPYGFRAAGVTDPFGHRWIIQGPLSTASPASTERPGPRARTAHEVTDDHEVYTEPGDIVYVTWMVEDEQRTAAFFGELLGWTFTPGSVDHALRVDGSNLLGGLWGRGAEARNDAKLMYHVADISEAVAKVRALGGTATDPELMPYGWSADCTDDQGMEFWIYTPAEG